MRSSQQLLSIFFALSLVALYYWFLYAPLQQRLELAEAAWRTSGQRKQQAEALARLHGELEGFLAVSPRGLNLVSRLQTLFRKKGLQDRVQLQSRPPKAAGEGALAPNETALVRLDRLDLNQLQTILSAMDTLDRNVWVRLMEIRRYGKNEAKVILEVDELETE
jgi:hypothetical protein